MDTSICMDDMTLFYSIFLHGQDLVNLIYIAWVPAARLDTILTMDHLLTISFASSNFAPMAGVIMH